MQQVTEDVAPYRVIRLNNTTDIVNSRIAALKKKRDRKLKQARKNNNWITKTKAHTLCVTLKKVIKRERRRIVEAKSRTSNPRGFWRLVRSLKGNSVSTIPEIKSNEKTLPEDIACEEFASFFDRKVMKLAEGFSDCVPILLPDSRDVKITQEILDNAHSKMKPKKSSGPDNIPMLIVKDSYEIFRPSYLKLFNRILSEGSVPTIWKKAVVTPVFKKGDNTKVDNYCPVSGLCSLSKLFERCVLELMNTDQIEGPHQHGFCANHSTVTAMVEIQSIISEALESKKKVLMYSVDLSAAFDMLRPGLMMRTIFGKLPFAVCRIILDFLTDRSYKVKFGSCLSKEFPLRIGCAQGSTLGPKLFSMYCGDLQYLIKEDIKIVSYADDTYVIVISDDLIDLKQKALNILKVHIEFLKSIGMIVNISKTEAMIFDRDPSSMVLSIDGESFSTGKTMKVLGVTFDSKMKWDVHVDKILSKAKTMFYGLRILRRNLGQKSFLKILTVQFFSKIYYASVVWLPHVSSKDQKRIDSVHYSALRLICYDFRNKVSRDILDHDYRRVTPVEWSKYSSARESIRLYKSGTPHNLFKRLDSQSYSISRPFAAKRFFENSTLKIGRQTLPNKVASTLNKLDFDWHYTQQSSDLLRISLKHCLFKYPSVASHIIPGKQRKCDSGLSGLLKAIERQQRNGHGSGTKIRFICN